LICAVRGGEDEGRDELRREEGSERNETSTHLDAVPVPQLLSEKILSLPEAIPVILSAFLQRTTSSPARTVDSASVILRKHFRVLLEATAQSEVVYDSLSRNSDEKEEELIENKVGNLGRDGSHVRLCSVGWREGEGSLGSSMSQEGEESCSELVRGMRFGSFRERKREESGQMKAAMIE